MADDKCSGLGPNQMAKAISDEVQEKFKGLISKVDEKLFLRQSEIKKTTKVLETQRDEIKNRHQAKVGPALKLLDQLTVVVTDMVSNIKEQITDSMNEEIQPVDALVDIGHELVQKYDSLNQHTGAAAAAASAGIITPKPAPSSTTTTTTPNRKRLHKSVTRSVIIVPDDQEIQSTSSTTSTSTWMIPRDDTSEKEEEDDDDEEEDDYDDSKKKEEEEEEEEKERAMKLSFVHPSDRLTQCIDMMEQINTFLVDAMKLQSISTTTKPLATFVFPVQKVQGLIDVVKTLHVGMPKEEEEEKVPAAPVHKRRHHKVV
jgi:hypothetical protein